MKKILWIPQLATIDKVTGKTILNADSNMTILNGMLENLLDKYEFDILLPAEEYCNCSYKEAIISFDKVKIISLKHKPISSFTLRYDFDFQEMIDIISNSSPDFIVNNTPSLTRNIKAVAFMLKSKLEKIPKMINFLHFLDYPGEDKVPKEISYFMRQIEGILCSDLAVFQSYTVFDKAMSAINEYFLKIKMFMNPTLKTAVWNATYSQKEIDAFDHGKKWFAEKTMMFPNRLSSTNYSNHLRFFEAIRNVSRDRKDFNVIVNNPTKYMSSTDLQKACPHLMILNEGHLLNREQYLNTLHGIDIGVALFTQEGHGGVSSKQFQAAGCLPVFPFVNEYQYLMPAGYKGYCKPDLSDLEDAINYVLDVSRTPEGDELIKIGKKMIYERDSFEFNIKNVIDSLESL
jgi:hypothetical protein